MNVLFLVVDDLNIWLLDHPDRYTGKVIAPNIRRLTDSGYGGELIEWAKRSLGRVIEVVQRKTAGSPPSLLTGNPARPSPRQHDEERLKQFPGVELLVGNGRVLDSLPGLLAFA